MCILVEALTIKLLVIFFGIVLSVLSWCLFRDKEVKNIDMGEIGKGARLYLLVAIPLVLLYLVAMALGLKFSSVDNLLYMLTGLILPGVISSTGLSNVPKSLLVLSLSVVVSFFFKDASYSVNFASYLTGLIVWKTIDHIVKQNEGALADFVPAFLWLVGIYWTHTVDPAAWLVLHQKLILGAITVSIFMRWVQGPYLTNDKLYLKRIGLAVTGGLVFLIYINQLIVALEMAKFAVVAGVGFFLNYLFDAMDNKESADHPVLLDFKRVLFVGIFTVLISRLFGMIGLTIFAISMLATATSGVSLVAAAFWGGRVLLQSFVYDFNSNMTGINIMHTYVGAAMFAGFFIAIAVFLVLKEVENRKIASILVVAATLIAPVSSVYFLHAEPTASFFYSALVAASLLALTAKSFNVEDEGLVRFSALVLVPPQLVSCGILAHELIKIGNSAQTKERIIALAVTFVLASIVLFSINLISKKEAKEASATQG